MADIYGNQRIPAGVWVISGAVLTFDTESSDKGKTDLIATGCEMNYQRTLTPITPINSEYTYLVAGQPSGTLTIDSLIGPGTNVKAFLEKYADICASKNGGDLASRKITISPAGNVKVCAAAAGAMAGGPIAKTQGFVLGGVVLSALGLSVREVGQGSLMATNRLTLSFLVLEYAQ